MSDITNVSGVLDNIALVIPDSNSGYTPTFSNGVDLENQTPLIFHYEGLNQIEIASDITDHYAEDNTTLQDHASLRPEKISVHGFVGEVVIDDNSSTIAKAADTVSRLPLISGLSPSLSVTALNAYNSAASAISEAKSVVASAGSVLNKFGVKTGLSTQNNQQTVFNWLYGYWFSRSLFTVQTPWAVFENMMIETMRPVQDESTRTMTDFFITFKRVRFVADIKDQNAGSGIYDGRLGAQKSDLKNVSTQSPISSSKTILSAFGLSV
jgi:hypothetical protein